MIVPWFSKFCRSKPVRLQLFFPFFSCLSPHLWPWQLLCGQLDAAYDMLTSRRPCGPNKTAIRGATYDLAKDDPWKEPFENLPEHAFGNVADWERKLIQERVRSLRGT